jgi:hypothetical protein
MSDVGPFQLHELKRGRAEYRLWCGLCVGVSRQSCGESLRGDPVLFSAPKLLLFSL